MNDHTPLPRHTPVMLAEVLETLSPHDGGIYVDGTFGAGGYSGAILESADCRVFGIDRDANAIAGGTAMVEQYAGRLILLHGRFGDMAGLLQSAEVQTVDGVALDLGVSSMQLDQPERGFSFRFDGPLDMRMGQDGPTAEELVNELPEEELANVIFRYGEERASRRIAKAIATARSEKRITRTVELADIIRSAVPPKRGRDKIDPATRTFQALRIYINRELDEIDDGLVSAEQILRDGGRLAVVSFHSLEDRRVKQYLRSRSGRNPRGSRHLPSPSPAVQPSAFRLLRAGTVKPSAEEIALNPRARSARLRAAERTILAGSADTARAVVA